MSADGYQPCPKCPANKDWYENDGLKEYFEFWFDRDKKTFNARYSGECQTCGWDYEFGYETSIERELGEDAKER